ncbi:MAG: Mini-ribonuclease 3 [Clostridia bacterium]|nr:Mini-ribonuclease 3 [Clostridia bacterium]
MFIEQIKDIHSNKRTLDEDEVKRNDPVVLAYIGDSLYDLYVRCRLIYTGDYKSGDLHKMSVKYVCAHGQARALDMIEDILTEDEENIVRRAKNAKINPPKNCDRNTYIKATAFEALAGYLYLTMKNQRLEEIFRLVYDKASMNS